MSDPAQLAFTDARGGMNGADPPAQIAPNQLARLVNCAIVDGLATTRPGTRILPLTGDAAPFFQANNVQGSIFFNPAKGQGGLVLGQDNPKFAVACGGRKYLTTIIGQRGNTHAQLTDITGGLFSNSQLHLVWWGAWEDILLAADGQSNTIIFQADTSRYSKGYNTQNKPESEVPNGATCLFYAHARGGAVVNSRFALVGDILHREDQSTSANLTQFTEQVYWATGRYFMPPSAMGAINAVALLAIRNTTHGHSDVFFHCDDGIFSLDISQFPRSTWSEKNLVKHALLESGATGPYAVAIHDGDQLYRTRMGAKTLRSAAAESNLEGNPNQVLSNAVKGWFDADFKRWLRFASVILWDTHKRSFWTTQPIVQGRWRWHRGFCVRNHDPAESEANTPPAWEGLWTLHPKASGIIQFISGIFLGEERAFAWVRGSDKLNRLIEFDRYLREDVMEDGTRKPIRSQAITREITAAEWWKTREHNQATLFLRNIVGTVRWGVWIQTVENPAWIPFRSGVVHSPEIGPEEFDITENPPRTLPIPLGHVPEKCVGGPPSGKVNESRGVQFLVRWEGYCQFEGVRVTHSEDDVGKNAFDKKHLNVTFKRALGADYDDFEYSATESAEWITDETIE